MATAAETARTADPAGPVVPCPVTAVTLLEDRAEVERALRLDLAPGVQRLRLGPVSPLVVDRSLRAAFTTAAGATGGSPAVLDVRLVRLYTPPPAGPPDEDASVLRHRVHDLRERLRGLEADRQRTGARLAVLDQLRADVERDIAESAGAGESDPLRWTEDLDRVHLELGRHGEVQRVNGRRLDRTRAELRLAESALEQSEERPLVLSAFVDLVVEAPERLDGAGLTLHHLTPCALWRPAYRAELSADGGTLVLQCDAVAWQRTGEDWAGARLTLSTARTAQAAEPPQLTEDLLTLVDRTPEERRTIEVDLREVEIQTVGPVERTGEALATVPGVDDGGEVRLLVAPGPVTLPSDGRAHRIRLGAATLPARTGYLAVPELSELVSQVVRFRNDTGQVLLSGPVDLVRGSGFVGRGELRFTAVGAPGELSFGSEDTFRVVRSTEESRDTTTLTGRTVITRTVTLSVSRFAPAGSAPLTVSVKERIPVSELAAVEVRLDKERCSPPPDETDAEGVVRYELTLGPDERRTLLLGYEISAARSVVI